MSNIVWGFPTPNQTVIDGLVIDAYYVEIQSMMSLGTLKPGATYRIKGFNKNMPNGSPENPVAYLPEVLYDDGTDSGITIIMQAVSPTEMATSGYGEFYNPKYGDETTYNNTDGTGLYRIWDGDNPDPLNVPAYQVDDVVFWGGYAWKNLFGNVGSAVDVFNLDPTEWEKLPYSNSTWYELVVDEIKVDWNNGILVERYNPENQVRVAFNADQYQYWMGFNYTTPTTSPISAMAWGLYSKVTPEQLNGFYGISNVNAINSICETVSFKSFDFVNINLNDSYIYNNYFGKDSNFDLIDCTSYSTIQLNSWVGSIMDSCILDYGYIQDNILTNSYMYNNRLNNSSYINSNTLNNNGQIIWNNLNGNCWIISNVMDNSTISYNQLSNNSYIQFNDLDTSIIYNNSLINSTFDFGASGTILTSTLTNLYAQSVNAIVDLSSATVIFLAGTTKNLITDGSNNPKMTYIDGSGNLQVVAVNA
jgi:hypothetical protein